MSSGLSKQYVLDCIIQDIIARPTSTIFCDALAILSEFVSQDTTLERIYARHIRYMAEDALTTCTDEAEARKILTFIEEVLRLNAPHDFDAYPYASFEKGSAEHHSAHFS